MLNFQHKQLRGLKTSSFYLYERYSFRHCMKSTYFILVALKHLKMKRCPSICMFVRMSWINYQLQMKGSLFMFRRFRLVFLHIFFISNLAVLQCRLPNLQFFRGSAENRIKIEWAANFWRTSVLLCDHWYPCFGLLVTSTLAFKAKVDPLLVCFLPSCNGFLRFTSGATPADLLVVSRAAEPFWSRYFTCQKNHISCITRG